MGEESQVVIYSLTEGNSGDLVKRAPLFREEKSSKW